MAATPTPRQILETLLPPLRLAAAYARQIQSQIAVLPSKGGPTKFSAALTDADLSIQTLVEVVLLGSFPNIRFYGEEYDRAFNTKYFRAIDLGPQGDYLVTLDPIDGTLFYLDGFSNYQIIVGVLDADGFAAVLAISPAEDCYYVAWAGQGTYKGPLAKDFAACERLYIPAEADLPVFLGTRMAGLKCQLSDRYSIISVSEDYSHTTPIPNVNGILQGQLAGVILGSGKFIDGAALAFMAQEAGCIVTDHQGQPLPRLDQCKDYAWPGLAIATTPAIHQDLIQALEGFRLPTP